MNTRVFERFQAITGYDIKSYLENFVLFCRNSFSTIVQYYNGKTVDTKKVFSELDYLILQSETIESLFSLKANQMDTIDYWELLDVFTNSQTKLWTINNSSKWFRSAIIGRYGDNTVVQRTLKSRETFENVTESLGVSESDDSWVDIARPNQIEEEDYTPDDGSPMFKINIKTGGVSPIDNIVDSLSDKSILGKDIDKKFAFGGNDLVTVEYDDAVRQALDTILNSIQGSIPEFPEYGFADRAIGVSMKALSYPTIIKNMMDMFSRDGRWDEVNILDLYVKGDNVFCKISARTVVNNYIVTNVQI